MAITLASNAFLSTLTNLVAYTFVVPQFKEGGMGDILRKCKYDDAPTGDGVVFRTAGVGSEGNLNIAASSLLTPANPVGATEQYIAVNNKKVIPLTINKNILAQAFVNETGLSDYIAETLKGMDIVKKNAIFSTLVGAIDGYTPTGASCAVSVNTFDISGLNDPIQLKGALDYNAKALLKAIAKDAKNMGYLTGAYSDVAAPFVVEKGDLYVIMTEDARLGIDFDSLASMFSPEYMTKNGISDIISLPDAMLPTWVSNDVVALLCHRNKFVYGFLYQFAGQFFDLSNLNEQHFVHYAYYNGIVSALPCAQYKVNASLTPAALS